MEKIVQKTKSAAWNLFTKWTVKDISTLIMLSALHGVLVYMFGPLSWGPMQFRVSEAIAMPLVVWFGYLGSFSILISGIAVTFMAPFSTAEMLWNLVTFALWGLLPVVITKKLGRKLSTYVLISVYASVLTGVWVSTMLTTLYDIPFTGLLIWITIAELITMTGFGSLIYKATTSRILQWLPPMPEESD